MTEKTSIASGHYRHFKGNEYTVLGIARHSETLEEHVVYRQEYGDHGLWVRPEPMFMETVKIDGQEVPRFQPLIVTLVRDRRRAATGLKGEEINSLSQLIVHSISRLPKR